MATLTRRYEYNKKTYLGGAARQRPWRAMRMLDIQYEATKRAYERLADPGSTLTVEDRNYLQHSFEAQPPGRERGRRTTAKLSTPTPTSGSRSSPPPSRYWSAAHLPSSPVARRCR